MFLIPVIWDSVDDDDIQNGLTCVLECKQQIGPEYLPPILVIQNVMNDDDEQMNIHVNWNVSNKIDPPVYISLSA